MLATQPYVKTEQVESYGKHALMIYVNQQWQTLHVDYLACLEPMIALLEKAFAEKQREIDRLRWRLNHQTADDAEDCRQGLHHGDCGKPAY